MERKFTNEMGNAITASITRGPNLQSPRGVVKQLNVKLIGPKSTSENIITMQEAHEIWRMLGYVFSKQ